MSRKRCFDPVVDANTRILILGSLPGEASLQQGQYYANKRNSFWFLMSHVLSIDVVQIGYEDRLATLLRKGIGLWDVVADAIRTGSLDSSIKDHRGNDLLSLIATLPKLEIVAFNGKTAARLGLKQLVGIQGKVKTVELPSSSPAYTLDVTAKVESWLVLRPTLEPAQTA